MKNNASEISFYCLSSLPILKAAPKLIEKIFYSKQNLVVVVENEGMLKSLDDVLWSYSTKHFIAHGTMNDPHPEDQPVYLTTEMSNPNQATIIMALGLIDLDGISSNKYCYMFDGNNPAQLEFARNKWKQGKKQGSNIIYWQQDELGAWEKKV